MGNTRKSEVHTVQTASGEKEKRYTSMYKKLRSYIIDNNLQPGDVLPSEQTLCEMYGVSRNVLREALKGLTVMGVIKGCPGKGNIIQPFSVNELIDNVLFCAAQDNTEIIAQLLDVRKKLELAYMKEAYRTLTIPDIKNIRAILERIKKEWENNIYYHADDREFHMALFSRIDNAALHAIFSSIWDIDENFQVVKKMQYMGLTIAKHENIVLALEERNQEAFEAAMLVHFSSGKYAPGTKSKDLTFEET